MVTSEYIIVDNFNGNINIVCEDGEPLVYDSYEDAETAINEGFAHEGYIVLLGHPVNPAHVIEELAMSFRDKIISGDYTLVSWGDFTCEILINNYYKVLLWHKHAAKGLKVFDHNDDFILSRIKLTDKQSLEAWESLEAKEEIRKEAQRAHLRDKIAVMEKKLSKI